MGEVMSDTVPEPAVMTEKQGTIVVEYDSTMVIPESMVMGRNLRTHNGATLIIYPDASPESAAEMIDAHTRREKPLRWAIGQLFRDLST